MDEDCLFDVLTLEQQREILKKYLTPELIAQELSGPNKDTFFGMPIEDKKEDNNGG